MWGRAAPGCADASRAHPTLLANNSKAKTMTSRANFTGQSPLKMKRSSRTEPLRFVRLKDVGLDVVVSDREKHEKCLHLPRRVGLTSSARHRLKRVWFHQPSLAAWACICKTRGTCSRTMAHVSASQRMFRIAR